MSSEFLAHFKFNKYTDEYQREIINSFSNPSGNLIPEIKDQWVKTMLLTQFLAAPSKNYARSAQMKIIQEGIMDKFFANQFNKFLQPLGLEKPHIPDINSFPYGSFLIQFDFTLRKPYISKDDTDFYIIDNPVRKEWVFKVPYIAPSQWKGSLRSAMARQLVEKAKSLTNEKFAEKRHQLALLSGSEKGEDPGEKTNLFRYLDEIKPEAGDLYREKVKKHFGYKHTEPIPDFRGRLNFYPTYFNGIDLKVINPHDRGTGTGTNPIYFETVPEGLKGVFTLLYVPLDLIGIGEVDVKRESLKDLSLVSEGIEGMMTDYGFGAKTSSGFGMAENKDGKVIINMPEKNETGMLVELVFLDFIDLSRKSEEMLKEFEG